MAEGNDTTTMPPAETTTRAKRGRKAATATAGRRTAARTATAARHNYRAEAEALRAEVKRLERKLESQPGSSLEQSLIVDAVGDAFRDGVQTGLLLQGKK